MSLQPQSLPSADRGYALNVDSTAPGLTRHLSWLQGAASGYAPYTALQNSPAIVNFVSASVTGLRSLRRERNTTVPIAYPRIERLEHQFADLVRAFPQLAKIYQIGQTTNWAQPIWGIRVSDHPDLDEDEPAVLFTGLHHAREPLGAFMCKAIMEELLINYGKSPRHTRLVDSLEIWLVPIVNPDGYKYIMEYQLQFPWWRKNLRDNNGDGLFDPLVDGVDLNRNYDYNWNEGGDSNPASWFYRGRAAFSEKEVQALRDLAVSENFVIGVSYHSYGESILYPWGNFHRAPDQELIVDIAQRCAGKISRHAGNGTYNVLPLNGRVGQSSIWMYGEMGVVDFIIETGEEYFPSPEDIPRIAQGNLPGALYLMERALGGGVAGRIRDRSTGKPLRAEVHVQGFAAPHVKARQSDAAYGRFDRLLFPGNYTIEFRAAGYKTEVVEGVQVRKDRMTWLEISLTRESLPALPSTN
ncbi:MAG: M14 family zinc carboxypeptidase [candidate division KSB1 bacterium]|nr:M14 family zinc carboxypeptidase [candidate division KSB1 bacterium]